MSLCQPSGDENKFSCGACCGFFNLLLNRIQQEELLKERYKSFKNLVDFSVRHSVVQYRQERQKLEAELPKQDPTTYNCPYLSYIDEEKKRIGCMIHPFASKDPLSQNFSFYGASICQAYRCKNYEREEYEAWKKMFCEIAENSVEYSLLASDHISIELLMKILFTNSKSFDENFEQKKEFIKELLRYKMNSSNLQNLSSFEVYYEDTLGNPVETLIKRFEIKEEDTIKKLYAYYNYKESLKD
ncbi:MAG: hypothetical protein H7A25_08465 [Leptospiraceae bacterium]|nr:hypothetical protein [Leptospiraceae bacterium]MCP5499921.1 hypothetical protein [Leptospiraceae bacterium]